MHDGRGHARHGLPATVPPAGPVPNRHRSRAATRRTNGYRRSGTGLATGTDPRWSTRRVPRWVPVAYQPGHRETSPPHAARREPAPVGAAGTAGIRRCVFRHRPRRTTGSWRSVAFSARPLRQSIEHREPNAVNALPARHAARRRARPETAHAPRIRRLRQIHRRPVDRVVVKVQRAGRKVVIRRAEWIGGRANAPRPHLSASCPGPPTVGSRLRQSCRV